VRSLSLLSLYAFSGLSLLVSRCSILRVVRYSRTAGKKEDEEEEKSEGKKAKKKLRDTAIQYGEGKGRRTIFFVVLLSIEEKKSRARKRGYRGREKEKEAAARRVH